jgi:ACS family hexuronate transporter-like MFS transporter
VAKFLSDGAWYFYLFWMPKYLYDARGFDIKAVAAFAWMPAVAAGAGSLLGGWLSGWLLQRDLSLNAARKLALAASALVMPVMILVPQAAVVWAMVFFCAAYFGHQFWATILMTLPADLYPRASVGAASGLLGCAGGFGGIAFGQLVGWLLDHGQGWALIFSTAGCLHVLSLAVVCAAVVRVQPLSFAAARARPAA